MPFSPFVLRYWAPTDLERTSGANISVFDKITGNNTIGFIFEVALARCCSTPRAGIISGFWSRQAGRVRTTGRAGGSPPWQRAITGADELKSLVGEHLGYSDYMEITQDRATSSPIATGDHQWIHVDVERAKAGLFGGPIAHGYLTLSLGPVLYPTIVRIEGLDGRQLRRQQGSLPAPVPVDPTCASA